MSEIPECPYCGYGVSIDKRRLSYDEKVKVRCPNCGGYFEYMEGWGAFSLPGEGSHLDSQTTYEGPSYGDGYESTSAWEPETAPQQQASLGTCCAICFCLITFSIIFPLLILLGSLF